MLPPVPGACAGVRERDVRRSKTPPNSGRGGHVREDGHRVQRFQAVLAYRWAGSLDGGDRNRVRSVKKNRHQCRPVFFMI